MSSRETMPCGDVVQRLWEYIDGELDADTTAAVWEHLTLCERCFPHYDFQRAFQVFLRQHDRSPVPPELRQKVFTMLLEEEGG